MKLVKVLRPAFSFFISALLLIGIQVGNIYAAPAAQASENVAVLFIIDNSGSMAENDSSGLRFTAAKLFISLLDKGDMAGALLFSSSAQALTDGIIEITGETQRQSLIDAIEKQSGDGWTDVRAAFAKANEMFAASDLGDRETIIVFLTDGEPAIENEYATFEQEALDEAGKLGIPIKSIALTPDAETPFLVRLVSQTNGSIESAVSANQLLDAFLNILGGLKDRAVLGSGSNTAPGSASVEIDLTLAPYIDAVSFVISKSSKVSAQLLNPNGSEIHENSSGVIQFIEEDDFVVVRSNSIQPGKWQFSLKGNGIVQARAIVNSRLRTSVISPETLYETGKPMPVVVNLFEEQANGEKIKIIGEASFSALIIRPDGSQESLDTFYDDGTNGDAEAGDGDFSRLYVNNELPGAYSIEVVGRKSDVPVSAKSQVLMVPFPRIVLDEPSAALYNFKGQAIPLQVHLEGTESPVLDSGGIQAIIRTPSGRTIVQNLVTSGTKFSADLKPTEDGQYTIEFQGGGAKYQGMPFTATIEKKITVRLIPRVNFTFESGTIEQLDLGKLELGENNTINIRLNAFSSASQPVQVKVRLQGLSGWRVAGEEYLTVQPGENPLVVLQLEPDKTLDTTRFDGQIVFSPITQIEIETGALDVKFEFIQPAVTFLGIPVEFSFPSTCFSRKGTLELDVISNLVVGENLFLEIVDSDHLRIEVPEQRIRPGANHLFLPIISEKFLLIPSKYEFNISAVNPRSGLAILPQNKIPVVMQVNPVWSLCRKEITRYGIILLVAIILTSVISKIIRNRNKTTLLGIIYYKENNESKYKDFLVLDPLDKREITIGSNPTCDLCLLSNQVEDVHARILSVRYKGLNQVYLKPGASVVIGYATINNDVLLKSGDEFMIGNYNLKYISDVI